MNENEIEVSMGRAFDIAPDELPIFLSEADEHLQTLDSILIQIEQLKNDTSALQAAFRAAHTLKGMAGMINHTRMVQVTHALETLFDGVRKGELQITSELIDVCLDAVDNLRVLRDEVAQGEEGENSVEELVQRFSISQLTGMASFTTTHAEEADLEKWGGENVEVSADRCGQLFEVWACIDSHSIASAARAFQLLMALQELGMIKEMSPSQTVIETAAPVGRFHAILETQEPLGAVQHALGEISEIEELTVLPFMPEEDSNIAPDPDPEKSNLPGNEAVQDPEHGQSGDGITAAAAEGQDSLAPEITGSQKPVEHPREGGDKRPQSGSPALGAQKNSRAHADMIVRTSVERLDVLMSLVGELITDRNHLSQIRNKLDHQRTADAEFDQLTETVAHLSRITDQLQEEVMRIRMLPIGDVFHKFPRQVRDLAQRTGKKVDLSIRGEDTELDRSVIEAINDPLIHLLRNAVDHGIEPPEARIAAGKPERGNILLSARHEQGRILITVEDDGRGIDGEALRKKAVDRGLLTEEEARNLPEDKAYDLIFLSGLSTAQQVSDISGRGVGMDIVRNSIQRINGNILIDTQPGRGTQFQITIPLTLAIIPTLLVRVSSTSFAIPIVMVAETLRLTKEDIQTVRGKPVTLLRNKVLPLVHVREVFNLDGANSHPAYSYAVVVFYGKQQVGLVVDSLVGEEEVVVKSLGALIGDVPGVSSATILGDGSVALILDVGGLLKMYEIQ